ncbi:homogentisate 1,2-dioxygenase [Trichoderma afarasin]
MRYTTDFSVKEKYTYHDGLGNHHQSEAFPGAVAFVNPYPQQAPYGCRTEKISGTAFVAPRAENLHTYTYRSQSSYDHSQFKPWHHELETANPAQPTKFTPNGYWWSDFASVSEGDWTEQHLLGSNGNARQKNGVALWVFKLTKDMKPHTVFSSQDGEALIVPQSGAMDITTELGRLLVRANEFAVIPRGIRYRVALVDGKPCRGYIWELYQGHFRLPELGIVGSVGLANPRDFQIPTAFFDGEVIDGIAVANNGNSPWTIITRLDTKLWSCTQDSTPFNVASWQGTLYPYKYDMMRFNSFSNAAFDHHDPSLYCVLQARAFGKEPFTAVLDFALAGPRWEATEDTLRVPWYHRNTMSEVIFPVINDPALPFNGGTKFGPFAGWMNAAMVPHGQTEEEYQLYLNQDTSKPVKLQDDGISVTVFETECPLVLSEWAYNTAEKNFKSQATAVYDR